MLQQLILNNFPSNTDLPKLEESSFILTTCQRVLVLSYAVDPLKNFDHPQKQKLSGSDAYSYLLEIICGLKSKLIGENEIVGQFKESYKNYVKGEFDSGLLQILEKLFKDAKNIRSNYLIGLSQKTYASIARKKIVSTYKANHVVILGSGQLAEDLINQFKKKIDVSICARNFEKVKQLADSHELNIIDWEERNYLHEEAFIVNSIGAKEVIFEHDFFIKRNEIHNEHLFIDLGSPSVVNTHFELDQGFMSLDNVFMEGAIKEENKRKQVEKARKALEDLVEKRNYLFTQKLNKLNSKSAYV